jgi:hypothetical protein
MRAKPNASRFHAIVDDHHSQSRKSRAAHLISFARVGFGCWLCLSCAATLLPLAVEQPI